MIEEFVLDITDIKIIVHKNEEKNFIFKNRGRASDGFTLITSGMGCVIDAQGTRYNVKRGDVIITNRRDKYAFEFNEPCSYITCALTLTTDKKVLPFIHSCTDEQFNMITELCKKWQSRSWDSYTSCRIGIMQFYLQVVQSNAHADFKDSYVIRATNYIHKNFKINFSGKDIAKYCSVSLSYLRSGFFKQTGQTIIEYRDSLRIAAAKEMLESKYFTITQIAQELGYCDVYHFSKTFRSYVGCPPTKWSKTDN